MTAKPTFEVDRDGLRKILARKGKWSAVTELIQNAWDENTTTVQVSLSRETGNRYALVVEDDNPEGFKDLTHAYTLFAESEKKANVNKRGRFNLGEKLVIALCDTASIQTTKGTINFTQKGREHSKVTRQAGTVFRGTLRLSADEIAEINEKVYTLIPPEGIATIYNGIELAHRLPLTTIERSLATEVADEEGYLRPTRRITTISVYQPDTDEPSYLYELGIPVVEIDLPWHIDVGQKVPLNVDRDNVTPAYMRSITVAVANEMADQIKDDAISDGWVQEAIADPNIKPEALQQIIYTRYGEDAVIYDPNDQEANKIAQSQGRQVIYGNSLPKGAWDNLRKAADQGAAIVRPAGQVTPSPKPYGDSGPVRKVLPQDEWTPGMLSLVGFTKWVAREIMDVTLAVEIVNDPGAMNFSATYAPRGASAGHFEYNLRVLGRKWLEAQPVRAEVFDLMVHEFGHQYSSDHLSSAYHKALTKLAGRLAMLAIEQPGMMAQWKTDAP